MRFNVEGPFEIKRYVENRLVTGESLKELKERLAKSHDGLSDACGCYVFAVRAAKGYKPCYVGQAQKSSILAEALNPANREKYNKVLSGHGTPVVFLIPLLTPKGKYRKRTQNRKQKLPEVDFLEAWLIGEALNKNPKLINNRRTKFLRKIRVAGYFNATRGESNTSSRKLRKALR
jgi:hypothetical protein